MTQRLNYKISAVKAVEFMEYKIHGGISRKVEEISILKNTIVIFLEDKRGRM